MHLFLYISEGFELFQIDYKLLIRPLNVINVWCIKFRSKHSSNTVLCLLRNLMHQTLRNNWERIFESTVFLNGSTIATF